MGSKLDQMRAAAAKGNGKVEPRKPAKAVADSPVIGRDVEVNRRGRFPDGTRIELRYTKEPNLWTAFVCVSENGESVWCWTETGNALHELLTTIYRHWLDAGKPGA